MAKKAMREPAAPHDPNAPVDVDKLVAEASARKLKAVFASSPRALGATYDELIASLEKIADAELPLLIVPRRHRPPT